MPTSICRPAPSLLHVARSPPARVNCEPPQTRFPLYPHPPQTHESSRPATCYRPCPRGPPVPVPSPCARRSLTPVKRRYRPTNSLHNRSALLGPHEYYTPPSSGRSSPFGGVAGAQQRQVDDLESQNDEHLEGLTAKVKMLKEVSSLFPSAAPPFTLKCVRGRLRLALGTRCATRLFSFRRWYVGCFVAVVVVEVAHILNRTMRSRRRLGSSRGRSAE